TLPVEIGKVFSIEGKVFRVLRLERNTAVISDGVHLSTVERPEQTASFGAPMPVPPADPPEAMRPLRTTIANQPSSTRRRRVFRPGVGSGAPDGEITARP